MLNDGTNGGDKGLQEALDSHAVSKDFLKWTEHSFTHFCFNTKMLEKHKTISNGCFLPTTDCLTYVVPNFDSNMKLKWPYAIYGRL